MDPGAAAGRGWPRRWTRSDRSWDLPERQATLRATVEWSVGLLDDASGRCWRSRRCSWTAGTIEAAAQVADLDEDRALELTEALARHSLIYLDRRARPRSRMLETIRAFVAERLAARPDCGELERRHADYYRALAEQADRPLRGAGQTSGWSAAGRGGQPGRPPCAGTWPRPRAAAAPVPDPVAVLVPADTCARARPGSRNSCRPRPDGSPGPRRAGGHGAGTALEVGDDEARWPRTPT
jgi:hypothetical protein